MSNQNAVIASVNIEAGLVEAMQSIGIIDVVFYNSGLPGRTHERWAKLSYDTTKESIVEGFSNDFDMLTDMLRVAKLNRIDMKSDIVLPDGEHVVLVVKKVQPEHLTCLVEQKFAIRSATFSASKRAIVAVAEAQGNIAAKKIVLAW